MAGSVTYIDSRVIFRFPYSPPLNAELKAVTRHRVIWNDALRGYTLTVSDLESNARLRAAVGTFVSRHRFSADAKVKTLLWPSNRTATTHAGSSFAPGRLTAELLPETLRGSDQRKLISDADWERLSRLVFARARGRCEWCTARCLTPDGRPQQPHCHELWTFTHRRGRHVQRLDRLIALCSDCHRVRHCGLAELNGEYNSLVQHLRRVNEWTTAQAVEELERAANAHEHRYLVEWDVDLSLLAEFITIDGYPDLYIPASER
jgi:hypothetical protein